MRKIERRSNCPISFTLDFLGDKWTFLILRDLAFKGRCFYKEFFEAGEGIATNVLSDRLKMLEAQGIVASKKSEELKTKKIYSLTDKGRGLIPTLVEMIVWGATHDPDTDASKEFVQEATHNRDALIRSIVKSLQ